MEDYIELTVLVCSKFPFYTRTTLPPHVYDMIIITCFKM